MTSKLRNMTSKLRNMTSKLRNINYTQNDSILSLGGHHLEKLLFEAIFWLDNILCGQVFACMYIPAVPSP